MLSSTSWGSEMSQKGWAQIATPPASWIASIASATVGVWRSRNAGLPSIR